MWQNVQPIAQPTCEDTHIVVLFVSGIITCSFTPRGRQMRPWSPAPTETKDRPQFHSRPRQRLYRFDSRVALSTSLTHKLPSPIRSNLLVEKHQRLVLVGSQSRRNHFLDGFALASLPIERPENVTGSLLFQAHGAA